MPAGQAARFFLTVPPEPREERAALFFGGDRRAAALGWQEEAVDFSWRMLSDAPSLC
ncbi:hypothetical protein HGI30_17820 [Paenibacillus albicereus]|uniref:Uncharacterized protein n=1 Tax=Paenibacillus albicereus TaxID=2726185 RepID=A0A6H2H0X4_9BACL|nr:hypothetical protein [Paenibacillus albicereus]QJC53249.1 hypothetical protein HGI30_17820 [Paenibacillus albicereus]